MTSSSAEFGNYQNATVTVEKYEDANADGDDEGDTDAKLSGWVFWVDLDGDGIQDGTEPTATTDANGKADFSLTPGASYSICEVLQADWFNSDPGGSAPFCKTTGTLASGDELEREFGNYQNATVTVEKYEDANADGDDRGRHRCQAQRLGLLGRPRRRWHPGRHRADRHDRRQRPGRLQPDPGRQLLDLRGAPGRLVQLRSGGSAPFCKTTGTLASGDELEREFGNYQNATVTVEKYEDANADGDDEGDTDAKLSGWVFWVDLDGDGIQDGTEPTATTDANGQADFSLTPGASYSICEVLQADWFNSDPGGSAPFCKTTGTLASGDELEREFGNYQNATVDRREVRGRQRRRRRRGRRPSQAQRAGSSGSTSTATASRTGTEPTADHRRRRQGRLQPDPGRQLLDLRGAPGRLVQLRSGRQRAVLQDHRHPGVR